MKFFSRKKKESPVWKPEEWKQSPSADDWGEPVNKMSYRPTNFKNIEEYEDQFSQWAATQGYERLHTNIGGDEILRHKKTKERAVYHLDGHIYTEKNLKKKKTDFMKDPMEWEKNANMKKEAGLEVSAYPHKYTPEQMEAANKGLRQVDKLWDRGPKKSFFFRKQIQTREDWLKEQNDLEFKLVNEIAQPGPKDDYPMFLDNILDSEWDKAIGDKMVLQDLENLYDETLGPLHKYLDYNWDNFNKKYYTKENAQNFVREVEAKKRVSTIPTPNLDNFLVKLKQYIADPSIKAIHLNYG